MTSKKDLNTIEHEKFFLTSRLDAPEIYADGATNILVGFPVTKIVLHTLVEPSDGKEYRKAALTLTMGTLGAIELANLILNACKHSEQGLLQATQEHFSQKLQELLAHAPSKLAKDFEPS